MRQRDKISIILVAGILISTLIYNTFAYSCSVPWLLFAKITRTSFIISLVYLNLTRKSSYILLILSSIFISYSSIKILILVYCACITDNFSDFMRYVDSTPITCIFISIFLLTTIFLTSFISNDKSTRTRTITYCFRRKTKRK